MNDKETAIYKNINDINNVYSPILLKLVIEEQKNYFNNLLSKNPLLQVYDEIESHLRELIKSLHPSIKIKTEEYPELINKHLAGGTLREYGVWAYYPWSNRIVHILDEAEFVEVRTNRNRYKITREEQNVLKQKKIGVIGLSVGQSIALTLAMERTCGELRLADFDIAELSNLNRIRTGVHNIGVKKTIIAAREILEIDPYLSVKIFSDGLTNDNMDRFFTEDGNLDLLVEVCDGLDIKIQSRFKARSLKIPVVMDTNDRGMLDVERFDLEPERPILHGLAGDLDPDNIKDLTNEEKIPYILKMVGAETISTRLKASMIEVEQSINTWPQLASSVVLGGALTTDVCRRILLGQYHDSGRYYIDLDELVTDKIPDKKSKDFSIYDGPAPLTEADMIHIAQNTSVSINDCVDLKKEQLQDIVKAAVLAPSGGNAQPWKFLYKNKQLFIFHDEHYSHSLLDYNHLGSYVAIGCAIENINIKSEALGLSATNKYFPLQNDMRLAAVLTFVKSKATQPDKLISFIDKRLTNRNLSQRQEIPVNIYETLKNSVSLFEGARLHILDDESLMAKVGELLAQTEMLRIIHPRGHYDTFTKEIRWTEEEALKTRDGLDVATLGATKGEMAAFKISEDSHAIDFLRDIDGGNAFKKMVNRGVKAASALGIITMPDYSANNFLSGGRAVERMWLEATKNNISIQPMTQLVFMLARLEHGNGIDLDEKYIQKFKIIQKELYTILPFISNLQPVFIFRMCIADEPNVKALRKDISSVLYEA